MPLRPLGLLRLPHRDRTPDKEDHSLLNVRAADVTSAACFFGLAASAWPSSPCDKGWRRISGLSLRRPQVLVIRFQDLGRAPPRAPHVSGLASLQDLLDLHVLRVGPHDPLFRRIVPDKQGQMSCSNAPFLAGCAASVITARWWRSRRSQFCGAAPAAGEFGRASMTVVDRRGGSSGAPYWWHRRQVVRCLRSKPSTISSVGAPISSVIGSSKRQDMKLATFGHSGSSGAEVIIRPRTDRFQVAITVPRRTTSTAAFCRSGAPRWGPEGRDAWVKPCSLFREQCRNWAVKRSG